METIIDMTLIGVTRWAYSGLQLSRYLAHARGRQPEIDLQGMNTWSSRGETS